MPLIPFILALLFVIALILAMPLLLVLCYRAGTARRMGRRWVATGNLVSMIISAGLFLRVAAITTLWAAQAFIYSLAGLIGGCPLGLLGLTLTLKGVRGKWHRPCDRNRSPSEEFAI